jgi:glycosyltransferase involved in cell wall biosynthesis
VDPPPATGVTDPTRIRVLQVITSLAIGGAERLVVSAAAGLPRERFDHAICCLAERGPLASEAEAAGVPVFCIGAFPGLRNPIAFARLVRVVRSFRPTIVHTHLQSANLYGRLAARLARVPLVVATEHNVYGEKARRYVFVERRLARMTDALVAVSDEVRQFLSRQLAIAPSAIRIVRNGVAAGAASPQMVAELRARIGGKADSVSLGTIASLTPKKGHQFLVRAGARLRERGIACSLVLAGAGPERSRLERLAADLGLTQCVHFLGAVRNAADVLALIDIFVLPSLAEGMPLALLEAMQAGKPVVATAVGGVPEVVTSGVNGLLVARASEAELADAIGSLAHSPELRSRLGAAARETIERDFTEASYLGALSALYLELAEPPAKRQVPIPG